MIKTAHAYQTAYAYLQEYTLLLYAGRRNEAGSIFNKMKVLYPVKAQGNELVDLASYLKGQLDSGSSFEDACNATNSYLQTQYGSFDDNFLINNLIEWDDYQLIGGFAVCPELK